MFTSYKYLYVCDTLYCKLNFYSISSQLLLAQVKLENRKVFLF